MATTTATSAKRKRPPTFQHLPIDRAKKLKQSWVEVQKIKSKWKAQKRKEGLVSTRTPIVEEGAQSRAEDHAGDADEEQRISEDEDKSDADMAEAVSSDGDDSQDEETGASSDGSADEEAPKPSKIPRSASTVAARGRGPRESRGRGSRRRGGAPKKDGKEEKLSIRELNQLAYSRSSLHSYKSQHRHEDQSSRGRGRERGRGSSSQRGRGRGQPDMRLRMNAMLEKIKKDMA